MSLEKLAKTLNKQTNDGPPIEKWNPPFCGDIPIKIESSGKWLYQGSEISRVAMVKLFATVLWFEDDEYFLVTPVEKVRIEVEDLPLVITQWETIGESDAPALQVSTSLGDTVVISKSNPMELDDKGLKVRIRRNLWARVHRNVYYQWAELAEVKADDSSGRQQAIIKSSGQEYTLGDF